jgi:2-polyprenyl-6-methoxyphenol hydroxylase-like FAD-dependent oxidoreductase
METPVLIVGAGPVGLALALDLGWRGVDCIVIDQSDGSIATPKMNEVNIRTMEFCRRWGIADDVLNCPFPADYPMDVAVATRLGSHELGRIERPARTGQVPGPHSPMNLQVCSQHWFDPILRARAQSFDSVRILQRHRLDGFVQDTTGVNATVTNLADGSQQVIRSAWMAGADGASSRIRQALGIDLLGSEALSHSMHLFFRTPDLLGQLGVRPGTFFSMIDHAGLWGNVRAIDPASGLWRLLFDVPEGTEVADIDRDACLERALARPIEVEWLTASKWTRRGVVASRYASDRIFLLGDAVHQVSPTGALGMNTGMADAVDLGWKLAGTLAGWGGPRLLESYDADRRPAGARNVRMATQFYEGQAQFKQSLAAIEDDTPAGAALRKTVGDAVVAHVRRMFRTLGLQIGFRYDDSPIGVAEETTAPPDDPAEYTPTARAGARAPHLPLADGRSTLDLFGRGYTLLQLGADEVANAPGDGARALEAAAQHRGVPLDVVVLDDPAVRACYERRHVLVRPDGHVAWRADEVPHDALAIIDRVRGV